MMILAIGLVMCTAVSAQQGGRGPGGPQRGGVNLDEIPGITADQKEKIGKIQAAQREEMQKVFGESRESRQQMTEAQRTEMRKKMEEMREKSLKEIESVLTPDQFKVYKEKMEAQQSQMRRGEGNRGRGPQARMESQRRPERQFAHRPAPRRMHRDVPPQPACPCVKEQPQKEAVS